MTSDFSELLDHEDKRLWDKEALRFVERLVARVPRARRHREALHLLRSDFVFAREENDKSWTALIYLNQGLAGRFGLVDHLVVRYVEYNDLQPRSIECVAGMEFPRQVEKEPLFVSSKDPRETHKLEQWSRRLGTTILPMPRADDASETARELVGTLATAVASRDYYDVPTAVTGGNFFGREKAIASLVADIKSGHVTGVFGLRKMGKTSIVKELGRQTNLTVRQQAFIFYDLETLPGDLDVAVGRLCLDLAQRFQHQLGGLGLRTREVAHLVERAERGRMPGPGDLQFALQAVLGGPSSRDANFLLALDEIESLVRSDASLDAHVPAVAELLGALRSLVQEHPNFNVILSGLTTAPLQLEMLYGRENPLFSWAKTSFVGTLARADADLMVTSLGRRMGLTWTNDALQEMYERTSGHAYLHRQLASSVASVARAEAPLAELEVTWSHVHEALRTWRRSTAQLVGSMLGPLERYYPREYQALELFKQGAGTWDELDELMPSEVGRLLSLGVLEESNSGISLAAWTRLAPSIGDNR